MLSHRIAKLRTLKGISQAQLAQLLHISPSTVGMYEQGRRTPNVETLVAMSEVLEVSLDYLITGSDYLYSNPKEDVKRLDNGCPCNSCYWREVKHY